MSYLDDIWNATPGGPQSPAKTHKRGYVDGSGFYRAPGSIHQPTPTPRRALPAEQSESAWLDFSHWHRK